MLRTTFVILLSVIIQINCQTCNDGNQSPYSTCSQNPECGCLQFSFSSTTYVCAITATSRCSQFTRCQAPNDACQQNQVCVRHTRCDSQPLCIPTSLFSDQSCPGIHITNYTSSLVPPDAQYTRPGGSSGTYYEAIQLTVPTSGHYDLSSMSGIDTHGYLYNGTFYPSNPQLNLIAYNDDGAGGSQFKIPIYLEAGVPYTLVVTTHNPGSTGPFTVVGKGPSNIYFSQIIYTTTTTRPIIVSASYNSDLTSSNPHYDRTGGGSQTYYYQAFEVRVDETGNYTFTSASSYDTYGYIYQGNFYPLMPQYNIHAKDDDGAARNQFQVTAVLRADIKYILVFTTHGPNTFGSYSVSGRGQGHIFMTPISQTFS
ncbi:unnamed protein product [Adineta ricciae]|uniref:Uncharacterized protein n=1 Tax=Adineta ricciae TaxID=249248 RepID=A0A815B4R3_ADIRI|nr:unnamed protein product [Adineta ricciae]CAF1571606.1 unnamed protein product [Adineta ricciae]